MSYRIRIISALIVNPIDAGELPPPPPPPEPADDWLLSSTERQDGVALYAVYEAPSEPPGTCLAVDILGAGTDMRASEPPDFESCFTEGTLEKLPRGPLEMFGFDVGTIGSLKVLVVLLPRSTSKMTARFKDAETEIVAADSHRLGVLIYGHDLKLRTLLVKSGRGKPLGSCKVNESSVTIKCKPPRTEGDN
jgi:hypothetical protein